MTSIADGSMNIQTSSESVPSTPTWLGEVVLIVGYLCKHGVLTQISVCCRTMDFNRSVLEPYAEKFTPAPIRGNAIARDKRVFLWISTVLTISRGP